MTSDVPYIKQFNGSLCVAAFFEMVSLLMVSSKASKGQDETTGPGLGTTTFAI